MGEQLGSVALEPVIPDALAVVGTRFAAVELRSATDCATTRVILFGGERALIHVLINLLVNACEGNGCQGASSVEVRTGIDPARPGFVRLEVTDDGPGFQPQILNAGPQRGLTTKNEGGGLGLGLILRLVQASGGDLAIENRREGGARVSVWLRRERRIAARPVGVDRRASS